MVDLARTGRQGLLDRIRELERELEAARRRADEAVSHARVLLVNEGCLTCRGGADYRAMLANLTATQERCTELFLENRRLRGIEDG